MKNLRVQNFFEIITTIYYEKYKKEKWTLFVDVVKMSKSLYDIV